jgi:hypothetical protein
MMCSGLIGFDFGRRHYPRVTGARPGLTKRARSTANDNGVPSLRIAA